MFLGIVVRIVQCLNGVGMCVAGVLHPLTGPIRKEAGRRVAKFGPVLAYAIESQDAAVQVTTPHMSVQ